MTLLLGVSGHADNSQPYAVETVEVRSGHSRCGAHRVRHLSGCDLPAELLSSEQINLLFRIDMSCREQPGASANHDTTTSSGNERPSQPFERHLSTSKPKSSPTLHSQRSKVEHHGADAERDMLEVLVTGRPIRLGRDKHPSTLPLTSRWTVPLPGGHRSPVSHDHSAGHPSHDGRWESTAARNAVSGYVRTSGNTSRASLSGLSRLDTHLPAPSVPAPRGNARVASPLEHREGPLVAKELTESAATHSAPDSFIPPYSALPPHMQPTRPSAPRRSLSATSVSATRNRELESEVWRASSPNNVSVELASSPKPSDRNSSRRHTTTPAHYEARLPRDRNDGIIILSMTLLSMSETAAMLPGASWGASQLAGQEGQASDEEDGRARMSLDSFRFGDEGTKASPVAHPASSQPKIKSVNLMDIFVVEVFLLNRSASMCNLVLRSQPPPASDKAAGLVPLDNDVKLG